MGREEETLTVHPYSETPAEPQSDHPESGGQRLSTRNPRNLLVLKAVLSGQAPILGR